MMEVYGLTAFHRPPIFIFASNLDIFLNKYPLKCYMLSTCKCQKSTFSGGVLEARDCPEKRITLRDVSKIY